MASGMSAMTLDAALAARRSVRQFSPRPVQPALVEEIVTAACLAPAPHHSRPWRFVILSADARAALTDAMHQRWRQDLQRDDVPEARIRRLLDRSRARLAAPPCSSWPASRARPSAPGPTSAASEQRSSCLSRASAPLSRT